MGASSNGIFAYGYDLGGGAHAWKVHEAEDGLLRTAWYDGAAALEEHEEEQEDEEGLDEFDALIAALYAQIPDAPAATATWEREKKVESHYGVRFVSHGDQYNWLQSRIIAAYAEESEYGETTPIDVAALRGQAVAQDWDGRLARALEVAGLRPLAEHPAWLLAAVESP